MRRLTIALLLTAVTLPTLSADLPVLLDTEYLPQDDFDFVQTELWTSDGGFVDFTRRFVYRGEDPVLLPAATFTGVAHGFYRVVVRLQDASGDDIAMQAVSHNFTDLFPQARVFIDRPDRTISKTDDLLVDADADGEASPGDTLYYTIQVPGPATDVVVSDRPGTGARLLWGTVRRFPTGAVAKGNGPGDEVVEVHLDSIDAAGATVEFAATVVAEVFNQGGLTTPDGVFLTDDPATVPAGDPTLTLLSSATGLEDCRDDVAAFEMALASVLDDPDADGVPAIQDGCTGTPSGAAVDEFGCSLAQFCAGFEAMTSTGKSFCNDADWLSDEMAADAPRDCRARQGVCEVR